MAKTCELCSKREICTKLCKDMENLLQRKGEGRLYSDSTIRRREQPYDPEVLIRMDGERVTRDKHGMSKGSDMSPTEQGDENN